MGIYIQVPAVRKVPYLIQQEGAREIPEPDKEVYRSVAPQEVVVCVVSNRTFDAAGIMFDEDELCDFLLPDARPRHWLIMDRARAFQLSGMPDPRLEPG